MVYPPQLFEMQISFENFARVQRVKLHIAKKTNLDYPVHAKIFSRVVNIFLCWVGD